MLFKYISEIINNISNKKGKNENIVFLSMIKQLKPKKIKTILIIEEAKSNDLITNAFRHLFSEEFFHQLKNKKKPFGNDYIIYSNTKVYNGPLKHFHSNKKFDLIICNLKASDMSYAMEVLAYEILHPLLNKKGHLLISTITAVNHRNPLTKPLHNATLKSAADSLNRHYNSSDPGLETIRKAFDHCSYFTCNSAKSENSEKTDISIGWLLLSRKSKPTIVDQRAIFPQREEKTFPIKELKAFYRTLNKNDCIALTANNLFKAVQNNDAKGKYLVKHDIHHDLRRTLNIAYLEAELGIHSVYFAIPDHELTKSYFGSSYMWKIFERIVSMGHELALHLDLHDLILKYGTIIDGIISTKQLFSENGYNIQTANLHGNTKLRKLYGSPKAFIRKLDKDKKSLPHVYSICDDDFKKHYASLSLESLSRKTGIHNWIDSEFLRSGKNLKIPCNCTDNAGIVRMGYQRKNVLKSAPFEIDDEFCENAVKYCKKSTTLFLIHPQYYEFP